MDTIKEFILSVLSDPERRELLMEHLAQEGFHADAHEEGKAKTE